MARSIFLALLALNFLLLGWQLLIDRRGEARAGAVDEVQAPLLSLVDTFSPDSQRRARPGLAAANGAAVTETESNAARPCLSLGPFADEQGFEDAQKRLGALGLSGNRRLAEGQVWVGYWIFLPPAATRDEAASEVAALRARGVRDLYIEPAGEHENAVSLGVFSERERAQRRFREIRELGFEPQIARRNRQGTVYWLDFIPDPSTRVDPADFQVASGRIVRLASRACPQPDDQIE